MYKIQVDNDSINAISFAGYRYVWSDFLRTCELVEDEENDEKYITLSESQAWCLYAGILSEDAFLPCLNPNSLLYRELYKFVNSIV
jgi:hypothetical protein